LPTACLLLCNIASLFPACAVFPLLSLTCCCVLCPHSSLPRRREKQGESETRAEACHRCTAINRRQESIQPRCRRSWKRGRGCTLKHRLALVLQCSSTRSVLRRSSQSGTSTASEYASRRAYSVWTRECVGGTEGEREGRRERERESGKGEGGTEREREREREREEGGIERGQKDNSFAHVPCRIANHRFAGNLRSKARALQASRW